MLGASIRHFVVFVFALLALVCPVAAHPHLFVDAKLGVIFDKAGNFIALEHAWTFDEAFSAWQVQGLDTNGDGITSPEEMQDLADENLVGLAEYDFYTYAGPANEVMKLVARGDARFEYKDGRSTLFFALEPQGADPLHGEFEIAVNDPEYYVAITFADVSDVTLVNAPAGCTLRLDPPQEMSFELQERLYALPPDVTQLPPDLAAALRGVQGAVVVTCPGGTTTETTALESIGAAAAPRAQPFGGPPPEPGFNLPRTGFLGWVAEVQRQFYVGLNDALGRLKADANAFWVLGGLSFLYGIFHAAGPGHGKVLISSYVLANERQVRRGVALSFVSALLQSLVAITFVLVAAAVLNLSSAAMGEAANWIGIASYALVALLGLWLVVRKLFFGHQHQDHDHLHDHDRHGHDHHDGHHDKDKHEGHVHAVTPAQLHGDWREQAAVVLGVGLRPCSGALVVLVFALSQGLLAAGIAAVFLMGLGTAITVAILATIAVSAKGFARRLAGTRAGMATAVIWWVELLAAFGVLAFGIVLLLAGI